MHRVASCWKSWRTSIPLSQSPGDQPEDSGIEIDGTEDIRYVLTYDATLSRSGTLTDTLMANNIDVIPLQPGL